ncbi:MAG: aldehyde ferredoxin oxidoreductase family protein [Bacteroidales bacterium]|nr:aldehyde ferredoxin oxidoreductase family protein [Bacteroidales bacterium]
MSYTNKYLYIDLTTGKYEIRDTDKQLTEKYIGGKALGFALLDKLNPYPEALSPENPLIFINGPLTGTKMQTSARTCLVTRSPLTGCAHDSHCGGFFGPQLKAAGFDYLYITGKAEKPVYLYITDKKIELLDASEFWGKGVFFTNDELRNRHKGKDPRIAAIGQAGENLSKIACIGVDKYRQYGRGGVGAVMGSKNLKAVVVDGEQPIKYFDDKLFNEINLQLTKDILNHTGVKFRRQKGTMKCIRSGQKNEFLPTHNWKEVVYDKFEDISSEACRSQLNWKNVGCFNCSIRCSKIAKWENYEVEGPEYETAAFLGSGCDIPNIKEITISNIICDDLGLDTISAGNTCSFAMECYEKGFIDAKDGLDLKWGNFKAQQELIRQMAYREGLGAIFTDGTRDAARKIGNESSDFAINIFGMELSGVNVKGCLTMGVVLSVADFASHTRLWCTEQEMGDNFKVEDIPQTVIEGLDTVNTRNSLIVCDFLPFGFDRLAPLLNAATGFNYTPETLMKLGADITNLARKYNLKVGRKHTDDILPERFFKEKHLAGFMRDKMLTKEYFNSLIQQYYKLRNWNEKGEVLYAS